MIKNIEQFDLITNEKLEKFEKSLVDVLVIIITFFTITIHYIRN